MFARNKQYPYIVVTVLMGMFLFGAIFTVSMGMNMDMNGDMTPCPFMSDNAAVCPMSVATHIAEWQQLFTSIPNSLISAFALIFSILFIVVSLFAKYTLWKPHIRLFIAKQHYSDLKVFAPLHIAFSRGILNSRLYA